MDDQVAKFRARVAKLDRRYRAQPYPADVRRCAVALADALAAQGLSAGRIGRRLGIRAETLASWRGAADVDVVAFAPVVVEPDSSISSKVGEEFRTWSPRPVWRELTI